MPGVPQLTDLQTPAERIRFLRLHVVGITQSELAKRCHVAQPSVAQWESGRTSPNRQSQFLIAEALGQSRAFIFGEVAA